MSIQTINENDYIKDSRGVINSNFTELDTYKAPLNSPAFTGTPTSTTPTAGDNSTKIATTEFVHDALSGATPTPITDEEIEELWTGVDPEAVSEYLPITGGTLTGNLAVTGIVTAGVGLPPVGSVTAFAGSTTPAGWLLCDGTAVSRATYADLFAVIGTTYGSGDGTTTFNLPDLADKFIQGNSTAGTVKSAGLPNITGTFAAGTSAGYIEYDSLAGSFYTDSQRRIANTSLGSDSQSTALHFDASRSSSVYGNSNTVQPPSITMRYIIKY